MRRPRGASAGWWLGALCAALVGCESASAPVARSILVIGGSPVAELKSIEWSSAGGPDGGSTGPGTVRFELARLLPGGLEAIVDGTSTVRDGAILMVDFERDVVHTREFADALTSELGFPGLDAATRDEPGSPSVTLAFADSFEHVGSSGPPSDEAPTLAELDAQPRLDLVAAAVEIAGGGGQLVPRVDLGRLTIEPTTYAPGYDPNQTPVLVASPGVTTIEVPASSAQALSAWVSTCGAPDGCTESEQQISVGIHYRNAAADEVFDVVLGSVVVAGMTDVPDVDPPRVRIELAPGDVTGTLRRGCESSCTKDAHCSVGEVCSGGTCRPRQTFCFNAAFSMNDRGDVRDCGGLSCSPTTGLCRAYASSSSDCAWGFLFDGNESCVPSFTGCAVDEPAVDCAAREADFLGRRGAWYDANPYPIWTRACRAPCSGPAQCTGSEMCLGGRCVLEATYCGMVDGAEASVDPNTSAATPCGVYACEDVTGLCNTTCLASSDCLTGYACGQGVCQ